MDRLPQEVIEKILSNISLDTNDVVNFSSTCRRYRPLISKKSVIWKRRFQKKYPKLAALIDNNECDFYEKTHYFCRLKRETMTLLKTMTQYSYTNFVFSQKCKEEWKNLLRHRKETYYYLLAILREIIDNNKSITSITTMETVPFNTPGNLTLKYYAKEALHFIREQHIMTLCSNFIRSPPQKQLLEKAMSLIAQWCELNIDEQDIENDLDDIAAIVKKKLFEKNPNHSIFKVDEAHLDKWKRRNLDKNQWSTPECHDVIEAIRDVLVKDLGYRTARNLNAPTDAFLIDKVIENKAGSSVLLAIIFESIGRRLGVLFEPTESFIRRLLLQFIGIDEQKRSVYYLDVHKGCALTKTRPCPFDRPEFQKNGTVTASKIFREVILALEFEADFNLDKAKGISVALSMKQFIRMLKDLDFHIQSDNENQSLIYDHVVPMNQRICCRNQRPEDLEYAVGMVMTESSSGLKCVIYGWTFEKTVDVDLSFNDYLSEKSLKQPCYYVLMEDGSSRQVRQDLLEPSFEIGKLLSHSKLGRYFSHYFANHFVPNEETEKRYPWDKAIRLKYYHDQKQ